MKNMKELPDLFRLDEWIHVKSTQIAGLRHDISTYSWRLLRLLYASCSENVKPLHRSLSQRYSKSQLSHKTHSGVWAYTDWGVFQFLEIQNQYQFFWYCMWPILIIIILHCKLKLEDGVDVSRVTAAMCRQANYTCCMDTEVVYVNKLFIKVQKNITKDE